MYVEIDTFKDKPSINMFNETPEFCGIKLKVDRIDNQNGKVSEIVMPLFFEEQPLMWDLLKDNIKESMDLESGDIHLLDVGTGSGFWSIIIAKNFADKNPKILGIDKISRCIDEARKNAKLNNVLIRLLHQKYSFISAPFNSVKIITLTPPYHIYPPELEPFIPYHAQGGPTGLEEFFSQLNIAAYHIAHCGAIYFNHMSMSKHKNFPDAESVRFISKKFSHESIFLFNIFPPMETMKFLDLVYQEDYKEWQKDIYGLFPYLFYFDGYIRFDGKAGFETSNLNTNRLCGTSWMDRIKLHRHIYLNSRRNQYEKTERTNFH